MAFTKKAEYLYLEIKCRNETKEKKRKQITPSSHDLHNKGLHIT